jgi:hypothetical protein
MAESLRSPRIARATISGGYAARALSSALARKRERLSSLKLPCAAIQSRRICRLVMPTEPSRSFPSPTEPRRSLACPARAPPLTLSRTLGDCLDRRDRTTSVGNIGLSLTEGAAILPRVVRKTPSGHVNAPALPISADSAGRFIYSVCAVTHEQPHGDHTNRVKRRQRMFGQFARIAALTNDTGVTVAGVCFDAMIASHGRAGVPLWLVLKS